MQPALLIIDMQQGMNTPAAGRRNNPDAEQRIADLLNAWRVASAPIVHVRHISRSPDSLFWPGQPGVCFQPAFTPLPDEHVVEKNVTDAFINSALERWLRMRGIDRAVIVGVSTNYSVEASARSASQLGFKTFVASDATFTFEKKDYDGVLRSAAEVHAMALGNLHGEYAKVMTAEQIINELL